MIPLLLWTLATIDAACSGYRAAAGRSGLIRKQAYYRHAVVKGALFGQLAVAIAGAAIAGLTILVPDREGFIRDLVEAGRQMLKVYLPYAALILAALGLRLFKSVDIRSLTSTIIFGPLTLIRPAVALAGLVFGVMAKPRVEIVLLAVLILAMMLSLERVLGLLGNQCRGGSPWPPLLKDLLPGRMMRGSRRGGHGGPPIH